MSGEEEVRPVRCAVSVLGEVRLPEGGLRHRHWLAFVMATSEQDARDQARQEFMYLADRRAVILSVLVERVPQ